MGKNAREAEPAAALRWLESTFQLGRIVADQLEGGMSSGSTAAPWPSEATAPAATGVRRFRDLLGDRLTRSSGPLPAGPVRPTASPDVADRPSGDRPGSGLLAAAPVPSSGAWSVRASSWWVPDESTPHGLQLLAVAPGRPSCSREAPSPRQGSSRPAPR
jgi:hypothetical protein